MKKIVFNLLIIFIPFSFIFGQEDESEIVPLTEAGENLDLEAVMELFNNAESVEEFENALNDSTNACPLVCQALRSRA